MALPLVALVRKLVAGALEGSTNSLSAVLSCHRVLLSVKSKSSTRVSKAGDLMSWLLLHLGSTPSLSGDSQAHCSKTRYAR